MRKKTTKQVVSIAIVGLFSLVSSCTRKVDPASEARPGIIKSGHDEPIIIEQGSVLVNFSPIHSYPDVGELSDERRHFVRFAAGPIKYLKMWRKPSGGSFAKVDCGIANKYTCDVQRQSLRLGLRGTGFLSFLWTSNAYTPVIMHSNGAYQFNQVAASPYRIQSASDIKVSNVVFYDGTAVRDITVRKDDDDIVRVHLCSSLATTPFNHCPDI